MFPGRAATEVFTAQDDGKIGFKFIGPHKADCTVRQAALAGRHAIHRIHAEVLAFFREHAPLAIAEAGARVVLAEFYARIFFRNCVNGGYLVPCETVDRLVEITQTGDELMVDIDQSLVTNVTRNTTHKLKPLGDVKPIIDAGGVFQYAREAGMLKPM